MKNITKRVLSMVLTLVLLLSFIVMPAQATGGMITYRIEEQGVHLSGGGSFSIQGTGALTTNLISLKNGIFYISMKNVNIATSGRSPCFSIGENTTVFLTLAGSNSLKVDNENANQAVLSVPETAHLVIDGEGSLSAVSDRNSNGSSPCIGVGYEKTCGEITINGGEITAVSRTGMAIGTLGALGGNITISGGVVNVQGGRYGIGGGSNSPSDSKILISGGVVNIWNQRGGLINRAGDIVISGGKVKMESIAASYPEAAIVAKNLTITGGSVTARGKAEGIIAERFTVQNAPKLFVQGYFNAIICKTTELSIPLLQCNFTTTFAFDKDKPIVLRTKDGVVFQIKQGSAGWSDYKASVVTSEVTPGTYRADTVRYTQNAHFVEGEKELMQFDFAFPDEKKLTSVDLNMLGWYITYDMGDARPLDPGGNRQVLHGYNAQDYTRLVAGQNWRTGYLFDGWYADAEHTIIFDFLTPIVKDTTIYAKWTPRADTKYSVQHFQQDITGTGYTLFETDALTGTTDAAATAEKKSYTGFHENATHISRVPTGTIAPDGSLVLSLYYDRDTFTATFQSNGGSSVPAQSGIRFQDVASTPAAPTKTGYDFAGWFADNQLTISYDFSSEVTANVTLYAKWTPRADTKYSVKHFRQDVTGIGYTLNETDALTGTTDAAATAEKKSYTGFHENAAHISRVPTGSIAPDGSLTLALYYDRDTFTATFDSNGGTDVPAQSGIRFQDVASTPAAPTKTGYDFAGWFADAQLTISYDFASEVTGDVTLYAKWTPRADTKYSVQHFQQNIIGTGYTLNETDALTGTTDVTATAAAKTYTGFHENAVHLNRVPTGSIAPDGSLVLSLYYDRDTFTATFDSNGGTDVPAQSGIRFQDVASTPAAPTKTGYDFAGWFADAQLTISYDFAAEVTTSLTIYAKWTPRADTKYSVRHFRQNIIGTGYTLFETDALTGTTDATATAEKKSYTGFHENATHISRVPTGTIAPDGSLTLALYYDRDTFTIQLDTNGGSPIDDCIIARYGSPLGALPVPARANFEFAGWYTQQNGGTKVTAETPAADIGTTSLYAQWLAEDCGIIDGTVVVDGDGNPVEGAKITIRAGNKDYKSCTTDALGTFAIFGVNYGVYNLVAEKSGTVVTTKIVLDHKTLTRTIVLPMGKTNSVVVVEDGAPEVVVGGLDSLFEDDTIYTAGDTTVVHDGGTVAIRLTVSPLDPEEGAQAAAVVLNVTVQKEVTATGALSPIITPLTELPDLMEIFIPLEKEAQGHAIYSVQRSHNGKLDTISASPNTDGEYLKVEQDILVVYAKKFSTFAISYSDPEDSGYRIRAIAGAGGAIAPGSTYVTRNRNKTFTITPASGYRIRDVLVDGMSVGSVTTYTFERVTAKHTIEAVFHSTACPSAKFTDVPPDTWYHDAADDLIAAGVMLGTSDKTFEPLRPLDRAQAVAMLSRLSGKVPLRSPAISFQDVAPAAWYFDTVGWSATSKVALGYGNDKFGPEDTVSREQLATMFFRYAGITPKALTVPIEGVSSWAATAMDWAVAAGILHGDDRQKLNPQGTATRAEAAVMFRQFLVLLEK